MEKSVFTRNGNGSGKSNGITREKIGRGGDTLQRAYPQDNTHGVEVKNARTGGPFGGSPTNLSHSLSGGVSAVQDRVGKSSR